MPQTLEHILSDQRDSARIAEINEFNLPPTATWPAIKRVRDRQWHKAFHD